MISIRTIQNNDDPRFVCELFPITRINQDFLLAMKTKIFKFL